MEIDNESKNNNKHPRKSHENLNKLGRPPAAKKSRIAKSPLKPNVSRPKRKKVLTTADDNAEFSNESFGEEYHCNGNNSDLGEESRIKSISPSPILPFKMLTRSRDMSDSNSQKPIDSPFKEFCAGLSPIQSRQHTPISLIKTNPPKSNEYILKLPSPMLISKNDLGHSPLNVFPRRHIQKLDFSASKILLRTKDDEIQIEQDNIPSNVKETEDDNEHTPFKQLQCNESLSLSKTEHSPNFSQRFQKSRYNAVNPFPVKTSSYKNVSVPAVPTTPDDIHVINPKDFREKSHFPTNMSNRQPVRHSLHSAETQDGERTPSPHSQQKTKRIYLDSMNSFSGKESNAVENLFAARKNLLLTYSNQSYGHNSHNGSLSKRIDEEQDDTNSISASIATNGKKKVTCNCKKSKCLKLYCDCFAANEPCGPECNCCTCHNNEDHSDERNNAMMGVLERNPSAFKPKIDKEIEVPEVGIIDNKVRHHKGCNCKKSGCLKKYCECFAAGVKCSELCKCETCKNMDTCTILKKVQNYNLLSMTLHSHERSARSHENSQHDCESCSRGRFIKEEGEDLEEYHKAYAGKHSSKKVKMAPQQIDSFNSFQSTNMINQMLQKKIKPEDAPVYKRKSHPVEELQRMEVAPRAHSHSRRDDTEHFSKPDREARLINFAEHPHKDDHQRRHSGRKNMQTYYYDNDYDEIAIKGEN